MQKDTRSIVSGCRVFYRELFSVVAYAACLPYQRQPEVFHRVHIDRVNAALPAFSRDPGLSGRVWDFCKLIYRLLY